MKQNPKILETELKKIHQLMEDVAIVNSGDLHNNNWSAKYHIYKKQGVKPYIKNGYTLTPLGTKETSYSKGRISESNIGFNLTKVIYMFPEQANELNELGQQIQELILQYNKKYNQYANE